MSQLPDQQSESSNSSSTESVNGNHKEHKEKLVASVQLLTEIFKCSNELKNIPEVIDFLNNNENINDKIDLVIKKYKASSINELKDKSFEDIIDYIKEESDKEINTRNPILDSKKIENKTGVINFLLRDRTFGVLRGPLPPLQHEVAQFVKKFGNDESISSHKILADAIEVRNYIANNYRVYMEKNKKNTTTSDPAKDTKPEEQLPLATPPLIEPVAKISEEVTAMSSDTKNTARSVTEQPRPLVTPSQAGNGGLIARLRREK